MYPTELVRTLVTEAREEAENGQRASAAHLLRELANVVEQLMGEAVRRDLPAKGDWPCQQRPVTDEQADPRLVAFFYRLLRDGAQAPSDVEEHAIQARTHDGPPVYTNCHLELYARSLVASLTAPPPPDTKR
jgi:hypothetical protein